MQAERVQVMVQQAAAGNVEAFVGLVHEFAPGLRVLLAAHLDQPAALNPVEAMVWSKVRTRLDEWLPDTPFSQWLVHVAIAPLTTHLAQAARRAIDVHDALSHQIIEQCRQALDDGSELTVQDLSARFAAQPEATRTLLIRRYRERRPPSALAASLIISELELVISLAAARAACDWKGLAKPQGPGERLLPPLIEEWLNGSIDVDSRSLLATNLARDPERALQFSRQVRVHLALGAALAPFTREDAVAITQQAGQGAGGSGRAMVGDHPRTISGPCPPASDGRRPRMAISNRQVVPLMMDNPRPSPLPWIIGGGMVLAGIFAVVVMSLGSGATESSPSRPADALSAPTAIAPANPTPPNTPAPGSGGVLRLDPGRASTAQQRPGTAPVVSITGAATSGKVCQDEPLELLASLSHIIGVKSVEFYHGEQRLGSVDVAPYRWTWEQPASGSVTLTARVIGQSGVLATSPPVTLEILSPWGSGKLRREWWSGVAGYSVAEGVTVAAYPDRPQGSDEIDHFASPQNTDDNYLQRLRGYLHPPLDGEYTFWIAGDDESQLWLSEDDTRARLRQIAIAPIPEGEGIKVEEWERNERQRSIKIYLRRGQRYYVEVLHKEGTGEDHVEVGWHLPNGQLQRPIPGRHLSPANEPVAPSARVIAAVPGVLPPASVTTPNAQTTPPTTPVGPRFVAGINLGGDAVVIDGNKWLGHKQAEEIGAAVPAGAQVVALSDLDWAAARIEIGEIRKDRSWENKPLTLRGKVYPKGLGVHAECEIVYNFGGRFSLFTADVGVDDDVGDKGSVIFRVVADGKSVFDSGVVGAASPMKRVNVPVNGCKELKLVVTDGGDGNNSDHAAWGGPQLLRAGPPGGLAVKSGRKTVSVMNPKPAVDATMRGVLTSSLVGTSKEGVAFNVRVPPGSYQVFVWTVETSIANARLFGLELEGAFVGEIGALPAAGWAKYGPFPVTVEDGELNVVTKPKKGVPQLMGIAIFEAATAATAPNLLPNFGFENGPAPWRYEGSAACVNTGAHVGGFAGQATESNVGINQQIGGLQVNTTYTLTAWGRISGVDDVAYIYAENYGGEERQSAFTSTSGYMQSSLTFTTGATNTSVEVGFWKKAGTGSAWIDDFSLTVSAPAPFGNLPSPLVELLFDAIKDNSTPNTGSSATALPVAVVTQEWPQLSRNLPPGGGTGSLEFPNDPKPCVITLERGGTALRGMKSFTISAWVNCRGKAEGRGGNRLLYCCNLGGDGVDLVWREDGSIGLGINAWNNDVYGARRSSAGKITVSDQVPADNWRFLAVIYDSTAENQQVRYYFGNATDKATLDNAVDYNRGPVGANSTPDLTIGHLGLPDRAGDNTAAMFRGLIDQVRIWGSSVDGSGALTAEQIVVVQRGGTAAGK